MISQCLLCRKIFTDDEGGWYVQGRKLPPGACYFQSKQSVSYACYHIIIASSNEPNGGEIQQQPFSFTRTYDRRGNSGMRVFRTLDFISYHEITYLRDFVQANDLRNYFAFGGVSWPALARPSPNPSMHSLHPRCKIGPRAMDQVSRRAAAS